LSQMAVFGPEQTRPKWQIKSPVQQVYNCAWRF
jgi:hypothetical protein